jgi:hypothetical protein
MYLPRKIGPCQDCGCPNRRRAPTIPLTAPDSLTIIWAEDSRVRQFFFGLLWGLAAMYLYARFDPPKVLSYLNSATESAVKSTGGYGGTHQKK